jgi:hypothetical protein
VRGGCWAVALGWAGEKEGKKEKRVRKGWAGLEFWAENCFSFSFLWQKIQTHSIQIRIQEFKFKLNNKQ